MNITQKQKGILFMILSALSFASMQVVVRMSREIPTMEQICVRNLFILIVSFFIIRKKRGSYYGPKKYQPYLFGRSFFGFLGLITLFYASSHAAQPEFKKALVEAAKAGVQIVCYSCHVEADRIKITGVTEDTSSFVNM